MTTTQELLKSSLEPNLNNYGPEDVERLNDWAIKAYAALETLQAEVARLIRDRDSVWALKEHKEVLLSQMTSERDAALARLAELEKQEPAYLLTPDGKCYAYGSAQPLSAGHADATLLELYAAAGASPAEPSESAEHWHSLYIKKCQELHDEKARLGAEIETLELAAIDDAERYAVPPSQAQPPAPGEAAREYMTGYSDAKEWAQPSQADAQDAARYRWLAGHCRSTSEHWGSRWSIVVDGPAPKSHDSEDDFDAAIDAAINAKEQLNG